MVIIMRNYKIVLDKIIFSLVFVAINVIIMSTGMLNILNNFTMDVMYQNEKATNPDIKIIAIDDKSMGELGKFSDWSRDYYSLLVEKLNSDNHKPSVIGFDILFTGEKDKTSDLRFAEVCKENNNVVVKFKTEFL